MNNKPLTAEALIELLSNVDPNTIIGIAGSGVTHVTFESEDAVETVLFGSSEDPGFTLNID